MVLVIIKQVLFLFSNSDSGFTKSADDTKVADNTTYDSPLPAVADRQSCDGQGVYILSDGAANTTDDTRSSNLMSSALDTFGGNFSCAGGLADNSDGGWRCMGEFAKKLFDKTQKSNRCPLFKLHLLGLVVPWIT